MMQQQAMVQAMAMQYHQQLAAQYFQQLQQLQAVAVGSDPLNLGIMAGAAYNMDPAAALTATAMQMQSLQMHQAIQLQLAASMGASPVRQWEMKQQMGGTPPGPLGAPDGKGQWTKEMQIPEVNAGLLIGKYGKNKKKLEQQFKGLQIKVDTETEKAQRFVQVTLTANDLSIVQKAVAHIQNTYGKPIPRRVKKTAVSSPSLPVVLGVPNISEEPKDLPQEANPVAMQKETAKQDAQLQQMLQVHHLLQHMRKNGINGEKWVKCLDYITLHYNLIEKPKDLPQGAKPLDMQQQTAKRVAQLQQMLNIISMLRKEGLFEIYRDKWVGCLYYLTLYYRLFRKA